jgi:hypothetical protein
MTRPDPMTRAHERDKGEDGISKGAYTRVRKREYDGCLPKRNRIKESVVPKVPQGRKFRE